jgi:hypothetical protein
MTKNTLQHARGMAPVKLPILGRNLEMLTFQVLGFDVQNLRDKAIHYRFNISTDDRK